MHKKLRNGSVALILMLIASISMINAPETHINHNENEQCCHSQMEESCCEVSISESSCESNSFDHCDAMGCCDADFNNNKQSNSSNSITFKQYSKISHHNCTSWASFLRHKIDDSSINSIETSLRVLLPSFAIDQLLTVSLLC